MVCISKLGPADRACQIAVSLVLSTMDVSTIGLMFSKPCVPCDDAGIRYKELSPIRHTRRT